MPSSANRKYIFPIVKKIVILVVKGEKSFDGSVYMLVY
jgi:hypothetical protein